jgi:transcription antitermination factor NusG
VPAPTPCVEQHDRVDTRLSTPLASGEPRKAWYAIRVKPKFEKVVSLGLRGKGYEEFLPLRKARKRAQHRTRMVELPLFPGYLFCRFEEAYRLPVLTTPGVFHIVTHGGRLAPVPDDEIGSLQVIVRSKLPIEEFPYSQGDKVRIVTGPLAGIEGCVSRIKDKCRVVVSVAMLERSVAVEVAVSSLVNLP